MNSLAISDGECLVWQHTYGTAGYGWLWHPEKRKMYSAHRFVLECKLGHDLPHGVQACHTCDNRGCINPDHLWPGTPSANIKDCRDKGRHPHAKITQQIADEIRSRYSYGQASILAREYGLSKRTVNNIIVGNTWRP